MESIIKQSTLLCTLAYFQIELASWRAETDTEDNSKSILLGQ